MANSRLKRPWFFTSIQPQKFILSGRPPSRVSVVDLTDATCKQAFITCDWLPWVWRETFTRFTTQFIARTCDFVFQEGKPNLLTVASLYQLQRIVKLFLSVYCLLTGVVVVVLLNDGKQSLESYLHLVVDIIDNCIFTPIHQPRRSYQGGGTWWLNC